MGAFIEFIIKSYNQVQFSNLIAQYTSKGGFNMGSVHFDPNNQPEGKTRAEIQQNVYERLTEEQKSELQALQ